MIVETVRKLIRREHVSLLICLLVAANSVQGTVLCFGVDGHIQYESVFHGQCACHDHAGFARGADNNEDKHCDHGPCVDVPIDFDLAQISPTTERPDHQFAAVDVDVLTAGQKPNLLQYDPVSAEHSTTTFYFNPLRTIILRA